jgi:hypothetical protein
MVPGRYALLSLALMRVEFSENSFAIQCELILLDNSANGENGEHARCEVRGAPFSIIIQLPLDYSRKSIARFGL